MAEVIINFKGSEELKEAIRQAAFFAKHKNSSEFIRSILTKNTAVKKEFEKIIKKN